MDTDDIVHILVLVFTILVVIACTFALGTYIFN